MSNLLGLNTNGAMSRVSSKRREISKGGHHKHEEKKDSDHSNKIDLNDSRAMQVV